MLELYGVIMNNSRR